MNHEELLIWERIDEVKNMCDREQPVYEQISNFSIALYVLGHFVCSDLLSAEDIDHVEAGVILQERFEMIEKEKIPQDYNIYQSEEKYLMVIGDPVFPTHFALIVDMQSTQPFFSKLPFFGSGFDSLAELKAEFVGIDGIRDDDISYYRLRRPSLGKTVLSRAVLDKGVSSKKNATKKIYTFKDNEKYSVSEYQNKT